MSHPPISANDFNRYYCDTVVLLKSRPVYITVVTSDLVGFFPLSPYPTPRAWAQINRTLQQTSLAEFMANMDFTAPQYGYIDVPQPYGALYVSLSPSTQYKRGFCMSRTHLSSFAPPELDTLMLYCKLMAPTYFGWEEGVCSSCALPLTTNIALDHNHLYYKGNMIGNLEDRKTVRLFSPKKLLMKLELLPLTKDVVFKS